MANHTFSGLAKVKNVLELISKVVITSVEVAATLVELIKRTKDALSKSINSV